MEIIIDTNILFSDWMLRSEDSRAFLDFVERTGSIIYTPRIVWEEIKRNYRAEIDAKYSAYIKSGRQFSASLLVRPELNEVDIDIDVEVDKYLVWLRNELKFDALNNILPYGEFTERIANRVMAKRKPFNLQNSNEYKDTVLWETVLDIVSTKAGRGDDEVVLISNDSNAFGAGIVQKASQERNQKGQKQRGVLHPQLEEDVNSALDYGKAANFYYYESFAEFLASHYTPIKGIDESSVRGYFSQPESGFEQLLIEGLKTKNEDITKAIESVNIGLQVELDFNTIELEAFSVIQDFYVYPFQKGEIITASGKVYVFLKGQALYRHSARNTNASGTIKPIIEVKFNLPYLDSQPAAIHFESIAILVGPELRLPVEQYESAVGRIDKIIQRLGPMDINYSIIDIAKKIIDSMYEKVEPIELWNIDELEWNKPSTNPFRFSGSNSKYIPVTGKSQPFATIGTSKKKKSTKKK